MYKGFSSFSGYGQDTGRMWGVFTVALNQVADIPIQKMAAIKTPDQTFASFADVFEIKVS